LENSYKRHRATHLHLVAGLEKRGMEMLVAPASRLPQLNTVRIPAGADDPKVRRSLLLDHGIEIGAGLGPLAGKVWRIGLMGEGSRTEHVDRLLGALDLMLAKEPA
jgi:alanine-glyoxylate transaminase/serine-glyoxylate transaminase/serine-pyruvate transaminase